jgi:hypothetical protein
VTPQEIERTLEFILQHEAQTAFHLEQLAARQDEMQSMQKRQDSMITLMTELAQVQSQRLDLHDETFKSMHLWQREALARLDEILRRLSPDR